MNITQQIEIARRKKIENRFRPKEFDEGERLYVDEGNVSKASLREHMVRYVVASRYAKGIVLDAACGSGYGSNILAKVCDGVIALELNDHAIGYAAAKGEKNVYFAKADLNGRLPLYDCDFDLIASFETLEHIENQEMLLREFKRVLKHDGRLIISSPDKDVTQRAGFHNPFHVKELTKQEFIAALSKDFVIEKMYGQARYIPDSKVKKALRAIAKLDIFQFRKKIMQRFGLKVFVHELFAAPYEEMKEVGLEDKSDYLILVAICKPKK